MTVSGNSNQTINDFLSVDLYCDTKTLEIYKTPLRLSLGEEKTISFSTIFDKTLTNSMTGQCFFRGTYAKESVDTKRFEISSDVSLTASSFYSLINPGTDLNITGSAIKKNGLALNGYASITSAELAISKITEVKNGSFTTPISIPANTKAKDYIIFVEAYDKDSNQNILNRGSGSTSFKVKQILSKLDLAFDAVSVIPGNNLSYNAFAADQAGENMNSNINVKISSPEKVLTDNAISTSQLYIITTESNSTPGLWTVLISSNNLSFSKEFRVEEYPKLSFTLLEDIVTIKNVGNVLYSNNISVNIGNYTISEFIVLGIGESTEKRLDAPDGEYPISIQADSETKELGTSFLTGRVVAINDPNSLGGKIIPWVWILLIIILGLAAFLYYKKMAKHQSDSSSYMPYESKKVHVLTPVSSSKASIMEYGQRQKCAVVALKIKGFDSIKGNQVVKDTINRIISAASKRKGYAEKYQSGYVFIFAPILTRQDENCFTAVEFAKEANREIDDHNKRFSTRIDFGMGINEGEIAVEHRGGIFNYTSTGNTLAVARKIAEGADNGVYLSDSAHSITRAKVKVERKIHGWKVTSISNSEKYGDFINKFKSRNFS